MVHLLAVVVMVGQGALAGIPQPQGADEIAARMKAAFARGDDTATLAAVRRLVVECKRVRAAHAAGRASVDELRETDDVTDNALRYLATTWHTRASGLAAEMYDTYLGLFWFSEDAYEMRFFYAELLYATEQFQRAHDEYAVTFGADPHGKWAEVSAENAVRCAEEVAKARDPHPVRDVDQQLLDACARYLGAYRSGEVAAECEYTIASRSHVKALFITIEQ